MHAHAELIERFYAAFSRLDWGGMGQCYHPEIHFTDAAFDLHGANVAMMWRMLCTHGRDLRLEHSGVSADDAGGQAHWEARYTFSATGRPVHNVIDARFEFLDGLIVRHVDQFDFWRWSRQALGLPGVLLGWSGFLRRKVQAKAAKSLSIFAAKVAASKAADDFSA